MLVLAGTLAGCPARHPIPSPPLRVSADALLGQLAARRSSITSLRARARLQSGISRIWTRQALIVRRPDEVRIDVLSPFGLTLAVGTKDDLLWAYPPSDAVRYEGAATPANVARFLGTPISINDLVDILMGLPPARRALDAPELQATADGEYRVRFPIEEGTQTLWFSGDTLALARAEEARPGGQVFSLAFADYRDGFPHKMSVSAPGGGNAVTLAYDGVETNTPIDPALFGPPPAPRVLPLEAAPR